MRPQLLDAFCGAGGAAVGYDRAGFAVTGVDNQPQPHYPFPFFKADAFEFIFKYGHHFDFIHVSPPCQAYSPLRYLHPSTQHLHPDLVPLTRETLVACGVPWIMENVMTAPLNGRFVLCGAMFGLRTYRHRRFESPIELIAPIHPRHLAKITSSHRRTAYETGHNITVTGNGGRRIASLVLDIDWMTGNELSQAIPPAYTEFIGRQLIHFLSQTTPDSPACSPREDVLP